MLSLSQSKYDKHSLDSVWKVSFAGQKKQSALKTSSWALGWSAGNFGFTDITQPFKQILWSSLLASSCLFPFLADTEQYYHLFRVLCPIFTLIWHCLYALLSLVEKLYSFYQLDTNVCYIVASLWSFVGVNETCRLLLQPCFIPSNKPGAYCVNECCMNVDQKVFITTDIVTQCRWTSLSNSRTYKLKLPKFDYHYTPHKCGL